MKQYRNDERSMMEIRSRLAPTDQDFYINKNIFTTKAVNLDSKRYLIRIVICSMALLRVKNLKMFYTYIKKNKIEAFE